LKTNLSQYTRQAQEKKVVYGSELHEVLGVRTPYKDWSTRRLNDIDAVENEDFEAAQICAPSGQTKKDHIIKLDTAKEMAMLERNEKGKQVRRYFIRVEKKYKAASLATQELSPQLQVMINLEIEQKRQAEKLEKNWYGVRRQQVLSRCKGRILSVVRKTYGSECKAETHKQT